MKALLIYAVPIAFGAGVLLGILLNHNLEHPQRTRVVAVCDQRGNTVYTSDTGSVFVIEGCTR